MGDQPENRNGNGRRPNGTFAPGHQANPGGRPKGLAAAARAEMPAEEQVARMGKIARGYKVLGQKPTISEMLKATDWLAERGYGKAPVFVPVEDADPLGLSDVDRTIDETLDELAARREAQAAVEGTSRDLADGGETGAAAAAG